MTPRLAALSMPFSYVRLVCDDNRQPAGASWCQRWPPTPSTVAIFPLQFNHLWPCLLSHCLFA
jgi:hypothetical protein